MCHPWLEIYQQSWERYISFLSNMGSVQCNPNKKTNRKHGARYIVVCRLRALLDMLWCDHQSFLDLYMSLTLQYCSNSAGVKTHLNRSISKHIYIDLSDTRVASMKIWMSGAHRPPQAHLCDFGVIGERGVTCKVCEVCGARFAIIFLEFATVTTMIHNKKGY